MRTASHVTIFGAEPRVNYNRIMLSPLLAGEKTFDDIVINGDDWYDDNASNWLPATRFRHRPRRQNRGGKIGPGPKAL
jgi:nitrite reductase (NADH) large subunit